MHGHYTAVAAVPFVVAVAVVAALRRQQPLAVERNAPVVEPFVLGSAVAAADGVGDDVVAIEQLEKQSMRKYWRKSETNLGVRRQQRLYVRRSSVLATKFPNCVHLQYS